MKKAKDAPPVVEVYVTSAGDPSVGIASAAVTIRDDRGDDFLGLDCIAREDRYAALEDFRRDLASVFSEVFGEPAAVVFDFECEEDCAHVPEID